MYINVAGFVTTTYATQINRQHASTRITTYNAAVGHVAGMSTMKGVIDSGNGTSKHDAQ